MRVLQTSTLPGFSSNIQVQLQDFKDFFQLPAATGLNCYKAFVAGLLALTAVEHLSRRLKNGLHVGRRLPYISRPTAVRL
jgi:hypothetical protein